MGRTVRTYRDAIRIEETRWKDFRRTLRPSQRNRFDRIFDYARGFADAGTMMVTPRIIEVILLSAILEMLGEIDEIRRRVQVLEEKMKKTDEKNEEDWMAPGL